MRMLGLKASIPTFRWDLVYLLAQLASDGRPGVSALAPQVEAWIATLKEERDALEQAEDAAVIAAALLHKKDDRRDDVLIEMGGMARAVDKQVYAILFKKSPSVTARLGVKEESAHIQRILGELAKLPADHILRTEYEQGLMEAEAAVKDAGTQADQAVTALALQRSQLARFKLETDRVRLEVHGKLVALLKDKAEAEDFFRPTTSSPGPEEPAEPPPS